MRDRDEHLQWCKDRAIEYVKMGDLQQAMASFLSDMGKHPETNTHPALNLMYTMFFSGHLNTETKMTEFIEGFN